MKCELRQALNGEIPTESRAVVGSTELVVTSHGSAACVQCTPQ